MFFGYNTNGFAHHRLDDTLAILAELGYGGVGLTLDHGVLNPFEPNCPAEVERVRELLRRFGLRCVIETGARFLLDPRRKHQPTLLSESEAERERRWQFLRLAVEIAERLGADTVSFWSGTPESNTAEEACWQRLTVGCQRLADHAPHVRLAFEPEPGMFLDTLGKFAELHERVRRPNFGLTVDVGHLHCLGETPIADKLEPWADWLWNLHIEDMKRGVHDHLMFGEGEIEFPPVLACLERMGYANGVYVELSRHSHDAVRTAERALAFLNQASHTP